MSFFSTASKHHNDNTAPPGPGHYRNSSDFPIPNPTYAPFGSLSNKKARQRGNQLGPGQYNVIKEMAKPCISRYENRNIIIIKINDQGGYQFKSRANRFSQTQPTDLGPGYYESSTPQKTKSSSLPKARVAQKVRMINQRYSLERQPTLLSDKPAPSDLMAPTPEPPQPKCILKWSRSKLQRFPTQQVQSLPDQQKREAMTEMKAVRNKKTRPSAVFASKSLKSHFQTKIYKTNNAFKAELRKLIDYKDDQPGPGHYHTKFNKKRQTQQGKFQFFGSTAERFPQKEIISEVGPTSYQVGNVKDSRKPKQHSFRQQNRDSYIPKQKNPGPGSYSAEKIFRQAIPDRQMSFGSYQPRFKTEQTEAQAHTPNFDITGFYKEKQERKAEQLELRKQILEAHQNSCFASGSKRFGQPSASKVAVGNYELSQQDISSKLQKYNKLVSQLKECQLHKPPFMSSDERFPERKESQITHKDCWCLAKSVEKQMIEHESSAFRGQGEREFYNTKAQAPPVGHYSKPTPPWIRESFNSKFTKKNSRPHRPEIHHPHKPKANAEGVRIEVV